MFNPFRDKIEVEQNPLTLVNAEEVYRTGIVPSTGTEVTFNALSVEGGFSLAPDDIFGTIREGAKYFGGSHNVESSESE